MLRAGIWATARQLVVALQLPTTQPSRMHLRVSRTLQGRAQLADYLGRECYLEVVVPEMLHRFDPIVEHLHLCRVRVWLVPTPLVDDIASLIAVRSTAAATLAAALARLPQIATMRSALRRLPPPDHRQLRLIIPPSS